ncbi:MAG: hypothetical protein HDR45_05950, partial [Bacteroides sp.]|nr:hypothetical protein [Bacteroides sp.]
MNMTTLFRRIYAFAAAAMLTAGAAGAQGYFDDDIYFDAAKAKKEKQAKQAKQTKQLTPAAQLTPARQVQSVQAEADYSTGSVRSVDEYNRRGSYKPQSGSATTDLGENFQYTRRIERFSNPEIVISSNDPDLQYYYSYADDELASVTGSATPATVNIYVNNPDPWDGYMNRYFYSSAWSWATWPVSYYNPWWTYNYWGPTWSWTWGPSWGWGPS